MTDFRFPSNLVCQILTKCKNCIGRNRRLAIKCLTSTLAALSLIAISAPIFAQPTTLPLVQKGNLIYLGAFRVPRGATDPTSFDYGGTALGYNPGNNSLYLTGHANYQLSAEISIPSVINSANINSLATATLLQPFRDPTEGTLSQINPPNTNPQNIGGHFVYGGKLILTGNSFYDGDGTQSKSHFSRPLSLSTPGQVIGPYLVGSDAHYTSGYMGLIPPEWQALMGGPALTGLCCLSIIANQSAGPSISVFNPSAAGQTAIRLLGYPLATPLRPVDSSNLVYNLTTRVTGVVFPSGTRSVLFFGRHGTGPYCYGEGLACGDPVDDSKGTHAYPYAYQVWAYDANDLLAVKSGGKQQFEPQPYALWTFSFPIDPQDTRFLGGAAYDPSTQRIYISQLRADSIVGPLIQVFKVQVGVPTPTGLQVR